VSCPVVLCPCLTTAYIHPAIREYDAKLLLAYWLARAPAFEGSTPVSSDFVYPAPKVAQVAWDPATNTITPDSQLPSWISTTKLVAKPDQLIKRRGKAGLLALNKTWDEARQWIADRAGKPQKVRTRPTRPFFFFLVVCVSYLPVHDRTT
jgi:ATP citrate (pro-S)-lyase